MKPVIVIRFFDNAATWNSVGWGDDEKLMVKAKRAINKGKDPGEVMDKLRRAGFAVIERTEA